MPASRNTRRARAAAALLPLLAGACSSVAAERARLAERLRRLDHTPPALALSDTRTVADTAEPSPPSAQDLAQQIDLDGCIRHGLRHNRHLVAAYERVRAAVERIARSESLPDPQLTFGQFVEQLQTRTGPQQRRYSLTQAFPWFGELSARGDVARAQVEELWHALDEQRLELERRIAHHYAEYAYLSHATAITDQVLDLLHQLESTLQTRIAAGRATQADLLRLQVEIGRVDNERQRLASARPSLSAQLAAAIDWRGRGPLPLPTLHEPTDTTTQDHDELRRHALLHSPELLGLRAAVRTAKQRQRLVDYDAWPDLQVGVDYFETDPAQNATTPGSGDDPWGLRIGFTLPIWRSRLRADQRAAEHDVRAASARLSAREQETLAEVEAAAFALEDADRQLRLYRNTLLPRAREALSVVRAGYTTGRQSLTDLIDSERALLAFEIAYWRACRDHHQSLARLEARIGGTAR